MLFVFLLSSFERFVERGRIVCAVYLHSFNDGSFARALRCCRAFSVWRAKSVNLLVAFFCPALSEEYHEEQKNIYCRHSSWGEELTYISPLGSYILVRV